MLSVQKLENVTSACGMLRFRQTLLRSRSRDRRRLNSNALLKFRYLSLPIAMWQVAQYGRTILV